MPRNQVGFSVYWGVLLLSLFAFSLFALFPLMDSAMNLIDIK